MITVVTIMIVAVLLIPIAMYTIYFIMHIISEYLFQYRTYVCIYIYIYTHTRARACARARVCVCVIFMNIYCIPWQRV